MRQLTCSECGAAFRVLKEATTGEPVASFICLSCMPGLNSNGINAKVFQFPAASERLGSAPAQACDVTRRGDSSCRGVPDGTDGEIVLPVPSDELSVEL